MLYTKLLTLDKDLNSVLIDWLPTFSKRLKNKMSISAFLVLLSIHGVNALSLFILIRKVHFFHEIFFQQNFTNYCNGDEDEKIYMLMTPHFSEFQLMAYEQKYNNSCTHVLGELEVEKCIF